MDKLVEDIKIEESITAIQYFFSANYEESKITVDVTVRGNNVKIQSDHLEWSAQKEKLNKLVVQLKLVLSAIESIAQDQERMNSFQKEHVRPVVVIKKMD